MTDAKLTGAGIIQLPFPIYSDLLIYCFTS